MNSIPNGYKLRPDGNYEKLCIFDCAPGKTGYVETLVRSPGGALIKVLRKRDLKARTFNHPQGYSLRSYHFDISATHI